jgi:hypothetical protein
VGKPEGKRVLRWLGFRWKENIKMYLREICCGGMHWIHEDRDH